MTHVKGGCEHEYLQHLISEDRKQQQVEHLINTTRKISALEKERRDILFSITDLEKSKRLYTLVSAVHLGVLEGVSQHTDNTISVDQTITSILSMEDAEFLLENKHTRWSRGSSVFKEHIQHPEQKRLTRGKYMNISGMKRQRTPHQHISYLLKAKQDREKDNRLDRMEKQLSDICKQVSMLSITQQDVISKVDMTQVSVEKIESIVTDVEERVSIIEHLVPDKRKQQLYILLTSENKTTIVEASKMLGVSLSTTKRWVRELRSKGILGVL